MFCSTQSSPFVCVAAASKENASQVYSELAYTFDYGPLKPYAKLIRHQKKIEVPSNNGKLWTLASDGKRVHGYQPQLVVMDEAHATKDAELYRALRFATIARQGLILIISTAGNDTTHWYHSVYQKSKRILQNEDLDISHYADVWESDPDADLETDVSQWYKACPSLGTSYSENDYRRELQSAKAEGIGAWLAFQQLMGNRWVRPEESAWIDVTDFERYTTTISDEELSKYNCWVGVDLSETLCPTSVTTCFDIGDGRFYFKSKAWVAEGAIRDREKSNLPKYQTFEDLEITDGDMLDRNKVFDYIIDLGKKYSIQQVNFDPRSAYVLANDIANAGFETARLIQSTKNYDGPMREFERRYKEGKILHDGSGWFRYCLQNVRLEVNKYGQVAPRSGKSIDHVDGAISALLAFHSAVIPEERGTVGAITL